MEREIEGEVKRRKDGETGGRRSLFVPPSLYPSVPLSLVPSVSPCLRVSVAAPFNAADRLTLAYLVFSTALIIVCRHNVPRWATLLPIHLGLIVTVFGLAYSRALSSRPQPARPLVSRADIPFLF